MDACDFLHERPSQNYVNLEEEEKEDSNNDSFDDYVPTENSSNRTVIVRAAPDDDDIQELTLWNHRWHCCCYESRMPI